MNTKDMLGMKWDDFDTNISEYFRKLREDQRLFDVTLATYDGQYIQAHKIILSAASNFFSDVFLRSNHSNMLIYLKGISSDQLEYITDFIYKGKAFIAKDELQQFLETGKELQIKGLLGELQEMKENTHDEPNAYENSRDSEIEIKNYDGEDIVNKDQSAHQVEEFVSDLEESAVVKVEMNITNNKLDTQIEKMIEKSEGIWKCNVCERTATHHCHIKRHAETHIEGVSHTCHVCSKTFATRVNLQGHMSGIHSALFSCDICGKSGMNKVGYKMHKRRNHK